MQTLSYLTRTYPEFDWAVVELEDGSCVRLVKAHQELTVKCVTAPRYGTNDYSTYTTFDGERVYVVPHFYNLSERLVKMPNAIRLFTHDFDDTAGGEIISMHVLPKTVFGEDLQRYMRDHNAVIAGSFATYVAKQVLGLEQTWIPNDIDVFVDATKPGTVDNLPGNLVDSTCTMRYDMVVGEDDKALFSKAIWTVQIPNNGTSPIDIVQIVALESDDVIDHTTDYMFEHTVSRYTDFTVAASTIRVLPVRRGTIVLTVRHASDIECGVLKMQLTPDLRTRFSRINKWIQKGYEPYSDDTEINLYLQEGAAGERAKRSRAVRMAHREPMLNAEDHFFGMHDCNLTLNKPGVRYYILGCTNVTLICEEEVGLIWLENCTVTIRGMGTRVWAYGSKVKIATATKCNVTLPMPLGSGWLKTIPERGIVEYGIPEDFETEVTGRGVANHQVAQTALSDIEIHSRIVEHCQEVLRIVEHCREVRRLAEIAKDAALRREDHAE